MLKLLQPCGRCLLVSDGNCASARFIVKRIVDALLGSDTWKYKEIFEMCTNRLQILQWLIDAELRWSLICCIARPLR